MRAKNNKKYNRVKRGAELKASAKHAGGAKKKANHVQNTILHGKKSQVRAKKSAKATNKGKVLIVKKSKAQLANDEKIQRDYMTLEVDMNKAREFIAEPLFSEYISKNVGARANDVITALIEKPWVDDKLSEHLSLKLNETRRVLNILNTYGVVRYNINKNSDGWLTFIWYLDVEAMDVLNNTVKSDIEKKQVLPDNCNDFFVCSACSKKHNIVLPFELAFENKFRCNCGKMLVMISKDQAEQLYRQVLV